MEPEKTSQADWCDRVPVVLDTNAVLDWLVFANPACSDWSRRLAAGGFVWLVSPRMRDEMDVVMARQPLRARLANRVGDIDAVSHAWSQLASTREGRALPPDIARRLRCTDPSDQMFIDLAVLEGARWLITRDRALLKLARRARAHGLTIAPPEAWTLHDADVAQA